MVKTKHFICSFAIIALVAFMAGACGGGSSSGTSGSSDTTVTGGATNEGNTSNAATLKSVDAVSADLSVLDLSASAASASISKAAGTSEDKKLGSQVGDESMAGCQLNQMKGEAFRIAKEAKIFQCYVGKMQDNFTEFVIPVDSYAIYSIQMPATSDSGPMSEASSMLVRVGKNNLADSSLEMAICEGGSQTESFVLSSSGQTVTLAMKHHFSASGPGMSVSQSMDSDGDGELSDSELESGRSSGSYDEWGEFSGNVVVDANSTGSVDTISEVDSASILAKFNGNYGKGQMQIDYDEDGSPAAGPFNTVQGYFDATFGTSGGGFNAGMLGMFDAGQGSAKFSATGSYPAMSGQMFAQWGQWAPTGSDVNKFYCGKSDCDFDATQSSEQSCAGDVWPKPLACYCMEESPNGGTSQSCTFTESGTEHFTVVADDADTDSEPEFYIAATSIYSALVEQTLPSEVNPITKSFTTNGWDCSGTATTIDVSSAFTSGAFNECIALEEAAFSNSQKATCMDQAQDDASSSAQDEF